MRCSERAARQTKRGVVRHASGARDAERRRDFMGRFAVAASWALKSVHLVQMVARHAAEFALLSGFGPNRPLRRQKASLERRKRKDLFANRNRS
jgi:hypothetical protein